MADANQVTCRVRILQRLNDDGSRVKDPDASPGHYDLMIYKGGPIGKNANGTLRQYHSPVIISYGQGGTNELAFFNKERQHKVYAGKWLDFYYWTFKAEESKVNEMVQWLFTFGLSNPTFDDYNNDRLARYKVTKGQFKKYSRKKANCLMAVGAMCEHLGNTTISKLITARGGKIGDNHKYWKYYPYNLLPELYDNQATRIWHYAGRKDYR